MTTEPRTRSPGLAARAKTYLLSAPRLHLVTIAVLAVAVLVLAVWGVVDRRRADTALARQRAALTAKARTALEQQTNELLALSTGPLAWAFRAEMIAGDTADLDAYMAKLAGLEYVRRVVVFDEHGKVIASTNMKFKDQTVAEVFPDVTLTGTEPRSTTTPDDLRTVVPIMGFDRQIGTVVIDYAKTSVDKKLVW